MSGRVIEQFMWGYQDHFRISLDFGLESALSSIGFSYEARSMLIGFRTSDSPGPVICVEQGEGLFKPSDLSDVLRLAGEKYESHGERQVLHSHPIAHENFHRRLKSRIRAEALEEVLGSLAGSEDSIFFAGNPVAVGDYAVHVVVSTSRQAVAAVPQITTTIRDRITVFPSLFHSVIWEVISRASRELYMPDAGAGLGVLGSSVGEVIRTATETMLRTFVGCTGYWGASDFHLSMNQLSALPYEGREGAGCLVLAKLGDPAIDVSVQLASPVKSHNTLAVRKLLEGSGPTADVLSDGENVYGLGTIRPDYNPETESVFVVTFLKRGYWELSHAGVALLAVRDGTPSLPKHVLDESYFIDLCERLFPDGNCRALVQAARAIGKHRHGAMLVISADAEGEAKRLSPQSWAVEPALFSTSLLTQLTDMDGAVLLDPLGHCHAIGVILDGVAKGEGDPARGSRLNNAVRYLGSGRPVTIVVVYSADGGIDILPHLHPRVLRSEVNWTVAAYLAMAVQRPPELERTNRLWKLVENLRFYLSAEQCDALNDGHESIQKWRMENSQIRLHGQPLLPDPRMNDSYWLPEDDLGDIPPTGQSNGQPDR
ncbi:diadenylate cyclase [Streptomyces sanyensis]|uniref:Diadenylate cyclase n=1 Tax=Streptomyces sanyensis TaxID=568869 RepID=A0ABP9A891_9ACTN